MARKRRVGLAAGAVALVGVVGLVAAMALVPGFGPRSLFHAGVRLLGGVTCDDTQCPPDASWVAPVDAPVTSGFRTDARPDHHGVDLPAAPGTEVVAASAGLVLTAECQASVDGEPYGCDSPGSAEVLGCGWYVKVLHAHHRATLYCHLLREPEVSAGDTVDTGQPIGVVGSTGNSSEPHLHFEVQEGELLSPPRPATAVDPVPFLATRGAPLA